MIDAREVALAYGDRKLLDGISFQIPDRARLCLAGPNGAGKTTLLKIINGESQPDSGVLQRSKGLRIGFLRQHLDTLQGATAVEAAGKAFEHLHVKARELEALHARAENGDADPGIWDRLQALEEELAASGYGRAEAETRKVLSGLGFSPEDQEKPLGQFSGGWLMRIFLARLLLERPDVLLLDEPTNHLDLDAQIWLEGYLRTFPGAVLLISHDRGFVDGTCESMLDLRRGKLQVYPLPYARYEEERTLQEAQRLKAAAKADAEIQRLQGFIDRFKAKASKAAAARSMQKRLDRVERLDLDPDAPKLRLRFPESESSGEVVFETEGLGKRFGDRWVFRGAQFALGRGEKIALVGPNGAGKTTLVRLLMSEIVPEEGEVKPGYRVKLGYYAQYEEPSEAEKASTLVALLRETHPTATDNQIRSVLGAMLFSADDAFKKYGVLSGGERARVRLGRLLLSPCNVLIMDEPTHHLDMASKDLLQQALVDYPGTVLLVSHDRDFVDGVATRVLEVRGGRVTEYPGDFGYYLAQRQVRSAEAAEGDGPGVAATAGPQGGAAGTGSVGHAGQSKGGGSDREARKEAERRKRQAEKRMAEIEAALEKADGRIAAIEADLCREEVFSDPQKLLELENEKRSLQDRSRALTEEWDALSETAVEAA